MKPVIFPAAVVAGVLGLIAVEVFSPVKTRQSSPKHETESVRERPATMATVVPGPRIKRSDEIELFQVDE